MLVHKEYGNYDSLYPARCNPDVACFFSEK